MVADSSRDRFCPGHQSGKTARRPVLASGNCDDQHAFLMSRPADQNRGPPAQADRRAHQGLAPGAEDPNRQAVLVALDRRGNNLQGAAIGQARPPSLVQGGRSLGRIQKLIHRIAKGSLELAHEASQPAVHAPGLVRRIDDLQPQRDRGLGTDLRGESKLENERDPPEREATWSWMMPHRIAP